MEQHIDTSAHFRRGETAHLRLERRCSKSNLPRAFHSVNELLELLHRQRTHSLRRWLGLEHARLFGKRVDALARWPRWLLLQLHVERTSELELTRLLQLRGCKSDHSLGNLLNLALLQPNLLGDGRVSAGGGQLASALHRLHGRLHSL